MPDPYEAGLADARAWPHRAPENMPPQPAVRWLITCDTCMHDFDRDLAERPVMGTFVCPHCHASVHPYRSRPQDHAARLTRAQESAHTYPAGNYGRKEIP